MSSKWYEDKIRKGLSCQVLQGYSLTYFPSLVNHTMNSFAASPIFHDAVRNVEGSFSALECVPEPIAEVRTTSTMVMHRTLSPKRRSRE